MSLTFGTGPFSASPRRGAVNFALEEAAPQRQLFWQPDERRLRAVVGDVLVLDTIRARLLHESAVVPRVYAPLEDYRRDVLTWSTTLTFCPWKGDASYLTLRAPGTVVEDVAWTYEQPLETAAFLRGYAALDPHKVANWFVEDDRVIGELRDPYHRVDAHPSRRTATVSINGVEIARAHRPVLVFETGVRPRVYFPLTDVADPALVRPGSGRRTVCQYKGEATYWTVAGVEDAAWSYDSPLPDALRVQGHLSFDERNPAVRVVLAPATPSLL